MFEQLCSITVRRYNVIPDPKHLLFVQIKTPKNLNWSQIFVFVVLYHIRKLAKILFEHRRCAQVVHRVCDARTTFRLEREHVEYSRSNQDARETAREVSLCI